MRQALSVHGVPRGHLALAADGHEVPEPLQKLEITLLFEDTHDVERWNVRWRHNEVEVVHLEFRPPERPPDAPSDAPESDWTAARGRAHRERFVFLTLARGTNVAPMAHNASPRTGDVAAVALYVPERDEALRALSDAGWRVSPQADA